MSKESARRWVTSEAAYWALALTLLGFGLLSGFTIGLPFTTIGLVLVCLAPFRHRAGVFWPVVGAAVGLFLGYLVAVPFGCSSSGGATVCRGLLGVFDVVLPEGAAGPSYARAWIVGGVTAVLAASVGWVLTSRVGSKR